MPGTFNGKTLTISATPTDGAKIPDKNATNVAGIAIVGSDMYCVKTTGLKTTLYKTANYTSSSAEATDIKQGLNWFALGLTKIGNYLYMLAEDHKGYGGSTTIVKLDTAGNQISTFSITNICGSSGALGITAADGTNEKFIIMHYAKDSSANTLTFSVVNWGSSKAEKKFTVTNSGYGYITQLQDIYYHTSFGLFILTNNTFTTLQNRILVVDYKNTDSSGKKYVPSAVIKVDVKGNYKQYNLESICMKANHLVLASNVVTSAGVAEDRFSVLEGITYSGKTFTFACGFKAGAKVPTDIDPNNGTTNLGCISFNDKIPYFVKQSDNMIGVLGYCSDYMNTAAKASRVITYTNGLLGHANGMSCFADRFYIVAGDTKVVALNNKTGKTEMTYTVTPITEPKADPKEFKLKAINFYYEYNTALLLSHNGNALELYKCVFGDNANVKAAYLGTIVNAGQPVTQDIFYHDKYGLFVATSNPHKINSSDKNYITTKNTLLHYDLNKFIKDTPLHPDFGFVTDMPAQNAEGEKYNSFELESVALHIDESNKPYKMVAVCNANVIKSSTSSGLAARDGFFQYHTIDFV